MEWVLRFIKKDQTVKAQLQMGDLSLQEIKGWKSQYVKLRSRKYLLSR